MSFWDEEKRVPIRMSVKKKVYARAKGKCESCGMSLEMKHGDFHHTRDPKVSAMAKTVQFLCPTCHRKHGHTRKTRTVSGLWETSKVSKIVRKKAPNMKKKSVTGKKVTKKSTTKKKSKKGSNKNTKSKSKTNSNAKKKAPTRSRTKSGRYRKKRSDAGKKRSLLF